MSSESDVEALVVQLVAQNLHIVEVLGNVAGALSGLQDLTLDRLARLEQALVEAGIDLPDMDDVAIAGADVDDLLAEIAELTDDGR